jgi:multisubunit Na+/H+ antiporter MnhB subunit
MSLSGDVVTTEQPGRSNGSGAAAILAAGVGSFALALLALVGDKSTTVRARLIFYRPTGALSGVTTIAIVIWLVLWGVLEWRWSKKSVPLGTISVTAIVLLVLSFLLTFPPIVDIF